MALKRIVATSITAALVAGAALVWSSIGGVGPHTASAEAARPVDSASIVSIPESGPSRIDYRRFDERLQRLAAAPGMVGMAVGVIENGQISFLKGYGTTEVDNNDPVTPDTLFRWASLSKGVAGDMVATLASQRKLSLNDPVGRYSASLRLPDGNEQRATVTDLLSHRLGIFSHAEEANLESGLDARQLRMQLGTLKTTCPPGTCFAYQNVAYDAASEMVEKVTGEPYRDVVRRQLFLPLGMSSANVTLDGLTSAKSWARPHVGVGRHPQTVPVTDSYYRVPAAGGVNSSIKDLTLWMHAQMGLDPGVLPPQVLAAIQAPLTPTAVENARMRRYQGRVRDSHYGLGWRSYDYGGHKVVGHWGGVKGYRSLIMFDPDAKTGIVALWNGSSEKPHGMEFELMDMYYGLPFVDWLQIDSGRDAAPEEASEPA